MKNLENYGVQALDAKEIREVDGGCGFLCSVAAGLLAGMIFDAIQNPDDFVDGFVDAITIE